MKQTKSASVILTSVFFLALFCVTLLSIFLPRRAYSETEKRALSSLPSLTLDSLTTRDDTKKFSTRYESYVADQFLARDTLVGVKSTAEYLIGKKDENGVYLGKNGYLFAKETGRGSFDRNLGYVEGFLSSVSALSPVANAALMLVPDSAEIYPELLPDYAENEDTMPLYKLCADSLKTSFLSPFDPLSAHKDGQIYYKTDHHWTTLGAYYGYQTVADAFGFAPHAVEEYEATSVSDSFYGTYAAKINLPLIKADEIVRYDLAGAAVPTMTNGNESYPSIYFPDALETADKYNYFLGNNQAFLAIDTGNTTGKALVLIKDSYAHSLVPFLADHYDTIYCIDLRYYEDSVLDLICDLNTPTDVLLLYQTQNFIKDDSIFKLSTTQKG